jgi:hypothetical protein
MSRAFLPFFIGTLIQPVDGSKHPVPALRPYAARPVPGRKGLKKNYLKKQNITKINLQVSAGLWRIHMNNILNFFNSGKFAKEGYSRHHCGSECKDY